MLDYLVVLVLLLSLAALWSIMSVLCELVRSWIDAFAERDRYPRY
jgi:hypothetical protein